MRPTTGPAPIDADLRSDMPTRHGRAATGLAVAVALAAVAWSAPSSPDPSQEAPPEASSSTSAVAETSAPPSPSTSESGETAGSPVPVAGGVSAPEARPNIVVIMADDMRADEIRFMPNVQRLIGDQGVVFDNSFSPYPLCCPARASFVTGQYTHNHGVWSNFPPYGFPALDDDHTLATELDEAGYTTVFLGKYLNGYGTEPPHGELSGDSLRYVPPGWDDWQGGVTGPADWDSPEAGGVYRFWDMTLSANGTLEGHPGIYQTRLLGTRSAQLITQYARSPRPFFLWASYVAPHTGSPQESDDPEPVVRETGPSTAFRTPARPRSVRGMFDDVITAAPGAAGEGDVSDKPFFIRDLPQANTEEQAGMLALARQRAESLHVLDQEVERTVEALEATGQLENTIVVFTSDNGFFLGEHRIRMGKILPYEPALRVPTLMRGPGIPAGEVRRDPIMTVDFAPTFLDAAGLPADPTMDGLSLLDTARDGDTGWQRPVLTETGPLPTALRSFDDITLLEEPQGPSRLRFAQGLRTPRYLYVEHASAERELYDLANDPDQQDNLVDRDEQARTARRLARILDGLRDCQGSACAAPLPQSLRATSAD